MFDLERAIAEWRRQMAAGGIESGETLDELESHLRDDIDRRVHSGDDPQRAFHAAVGCVGDPKSVAEEFARSHGADPERPLSFSEGLCFTSSAALLMISAWTLVEFDLRLLERLAGFSAAVLISLYVASLPFLRKRLSAVAYLRLIAVIKPASLFVALLPIWALLTATKVIHVEPGIVLNMVIWLIGAAVGITILVHGLGCAPGLTQLSGGLLPRLGRRLRIIRARQPGSLESDYWLPPATAFAEVGRQSLVVAREEALRLGHDFIGTEHVLLGVLKLARGVLANVLQKNNVDREAVRIEIERLVSPMAAVHSSSSAAIPWTPRAKKALKLARNQAKILKHPLIDAQHIFLGLLIEGNGVAALALKNLGIRSEEIRAEIGRADSRT